MVRLWVGVRGTGLFIPPGACRTGMPAYTEWRDSERDDAEIVHGSPDGFA